MNINIEGMTEYDLLSLARDGIVSEIEKECQYIAENCASHRSICVLQKMLRKYDMVDSALDELRHREEDDNAAQ